MQTHAPAALRVGVPRPTPCSPCSPPPSLPLALSLIFFLSLTFSLALHQSFLLLSLYLRPHLPLLVPISLSLVRLATLTLSPFPLSRSLPTAPSLAAPRFRRRRHFATARRPRPRTGPPQPLELTSQPAGRTRPAPERSPVASA